MRRVFLIVLCLLVVSCESDEIDESVREEIKSLFKAGVEFKDPFVRAETVRVITDLNAPEIYSLLEGLSNDPSPMVRVAVLRALIASRDEAGRSLALNGFTNGKRLERKAILEAVYEYGNAPLQAELTARALRSKDDELKRIAFEFGHLKRVDDAIEAGETKLLERTLFPELGRFVTEKDPRLAASALRKLIEAGEGERARPLIDMLENPKTSKADQKTAATILARAGVKEAQPAFLALIQRHKDALEDTSLGVPDQVVAPAVLRWAWLGLAASGDLDAVSTANKYRVKADISTTIEVLEALSHNPSADASIALRNSMKDARAEVRQRAIELYAGRADADATSLNDALVGADHDTHVRITKVLIDRFPNDWVPMLKKRLSRTSEIDFTLRLLRGVITNKRYAGLILKPLQAELTKLGEDANETRAQRARYLLAISDVQKAADMELVQKLDSPTLYSYLEFAAKEAPTVHKEMFRQYFYGDLFAIRLMAASGLWKASGSNSNKGTNS